MAARTIDQTEENSEMDSNRFDAWTRRVGGARSRHAMLGLLGSGALAAALPAAGAMAIDACALEGATCKNNADCCSQRCRRHKGKKRGQCRCSRIEGTECQSDADCCTKHTLVCDVATTHTCVIEQISDRARKRDVAGVDPADMLARAAALPIATWSYTFDDPTVRHIGPMAQDFAALFGVGADDRHIHPIDGQGVALAAIQGLYAEVQRLQTEQAALHARLATLEAERA
jgi:hypothetical protein